MNSAAVVNYTGCLHPTLRTMPDVEARRSPLGDTFPDIDTRKLRIAEEANLQEIDFMTTQAKYCTFDLNWQPGLWKGRFSISPQGDYCRAGKKIRSLTQGID